MFRILSVFAFVPVVCALLTCPAEADEPAASRPAATQPSAKPTYTIGHTYRVGEKRTLTVEMVREMQFEGMPDLPIDLMKFQVRIDIELEVGRGGKPDEKTVTLRFRRIRMGVEGGDGQQKHETDTDRPETIEEGSREALSMIGLPLRAELDSAGGIASLEGVDEFIEKVGAPPTGDEMEEAREGVIRLFSSFLQAPRVALPPEPVAVGAAWEVKDAPLLRDLAGAMSREAPEPDVECKFERVEKGRKGGVAVVSLRDAAPPADRPGASGLQGEARYDLTRQDFIEYSVEENEFDEHGVSKVRMIVRLSPPSNGTAGTHAAPATQSATAPAGEE